MDEARILICGVNWLGDACMSMPAVQAYRAIHPQAHIAMLVKPALAPLWRCHPAVDAVLTLRPGNAGPIRTGRNLRAASYDKAYIFPNSWRAALPPFIARIPQRIGLRGHARRILLTSVIRALPGTPHQQWEYAAILQLAADTCTLPAPSLDLPPRPAAYPAKERGRALIALLPGAARGPAKRWPAAHFIATAQRLLSQRPCRFLIMGTQAEADICQSVAEALPADTVCLAGQTTLPECATALQACDGVICNDSGGMHLAAAVGTPVVAIFGLTNPDQTGPLGPRTTCLQPAGIRGSRRIARASAEAQAALATITPEHASKALLDLLGNPPTSS